MFVAACADLHDYVLSQSLNRTILLSGLIPKTKQLYIIAIEKENRLESGRGFFHFFFSRQEPQSKANVTNEPFQKEKSVIFILGSQRN